MGKKGERGREWEVRRGARRSRWPHAQLGVPRASWPPHAVQQYRVSPRDVPYVHSHVAAAGQLPQGTHGYGCMRGQALHTAHMRKHLGLLEINYYKPRALWWAKIPSGGPLSGICYSQKPCPQGRAEEEAAERRVRVESTSSRLLWLSLKLQPLKLAQ